MDLLELVRLQARAWGLELDEGRTARLEQYALSLCDYEEANVIGSRGVEDILLEHVLDSLSCFLFGPLSGARKVVDVGSGGGLPGIAIKIVAPLPEMTLIESTAKKARFLRTVAEWLSLEEVMVLNQRVEEAARMDGQRGAYDVATVRAVSSLSVVEEYCVPLLGLGGHVIAMKGRLRDEELEAGQRAADELGARVSGVIRVPRLPEVGEKERCLVIVEKVGETPARYPRRVGVPARKPLGMV